jgi:hypothetical protein
MSVSIIQQSLQLLVGASVMKTRDGLAITTANGRRLEIVTRYSNEAAMLAGLLAVADGLKARGVVTATLAAAAAEASAVDAAAAAPDAFETLARIFPSNLPKPPDMIMTGGKLTYAPAVVESRPAAVNLAEAPPVAPAGVKRRRGKAAK